MHAFDVKASKTVTADMFEGLSKLKLTKNLVNAGTENQQRSYANVIGWRAISGVLQSMKGQADIVRTG